VPVGGRCRRLFIAVFHGMAVGRETLFYVFEDCTRDPELYELRQAGALVLLEPPAPAFPNPPFPRPSCRVAPDGPTLP
jgi:hypothetical protein